MKEKQEDEDIINMMGRLAWLSRCFSIPDFEAWLTEEGLDGYDARNLSDWLRRNPNKTDIISIWQTWGLKTNMHPYPKLRPYLIKYIKGYFKSNAKD